MEGNRLGEKVFHSRNYGALTKAPSYKLHPTSAKKPSRATTENVTSVENKNSDG